ncbi:MAG: type VI secretion system transmembrane protein TssO [Bacteroidales bacterium]|nr:type VI secretion system transmembrane protein TssO [Bacteroidales bacterium]
MKPLNRKERKASILKFSLVFFLTLLILFWCSFFVIRAGVQGITVLEEKHNEYNEVFEKQAYISFEIDEITKLLYQLKNKQRTIYEHKQFQGLISDRRDNIHKEIEQINPITSDQFDLYKELLFQIKEIQSVIDDYENESEEYVYNKQLLEKCREKYIEKEFGI